MNKNMKQNRKTTFYRQKLLAMSIAGLFTGVVSTSVTQASDIDIYQEAKSGEISLMFMLDISGSMGGSGSYDGTGQERIARLKTAMQDLLNGNATKKITKLSDDKVIGLSTLGAYQNGRAYDTGAILVPARRLDAVIGTKTQRQILSEKINGLSASTWTPTSRSYAETAAYLLGQTTAARYRTVSEMPYYRSYESYSYYYGWQTVVQQCTSWNSSYSSCSSGSWTTVSGSVPLSNSISERPCSISSSYRNQVCYDYSGVISIANNNTGFPYSAVDTKNTDKTLYQMPSSLTQNDEIKKCSGQGIYVLTDGDPTRDIDSLPLIQGALGEKGTDFTCTTTGTNDATNSYDCLNKLALTLLDPSKNPSGLKFKTAVVGFGSSFNNVASYDKTKTQQQNIDALGTINTNVKRAAYWGIIGEGGWYSGNSSQDVVDSVNAFLGELGTDIPAVTTGSPTIPKDSLNPAVLQKQAYFPQFQPTPDKPYQLWAGNLKKYNVISGVLKDKSGNKITDTTGRIVDNYDLWSKAVSTEQAIKDADENTPGSTKFALRGGAWSQLKLKIAAGEATESRKLLTNRIASGTGTSATFVTGSSLRRVTSGDLTDATYRNDANRGYLMLLLGYGVDAANPNTITTTSLSSAPELRQIGAVMHSSPLLVTNKGKVTYTKGVVGSENREDYVLFGTTQGLLHVVDAKTGEEKFSFVPNEMIEKQKQAFQKYDTTTGGMANLYYGIDGPWTAYTEYVIDGSGNLTVGSGKGINQKGKQIVYGGLRMGGRSYYALDLQNINDPKLKFHISPAEGKVYNNTNPTGKAYSELAKMGQSWSKPTIAWVNWAGKRKRVMFVGGGYDAGGTDGNANNGGYESDTYNQTNQIGGGVYMFDADDGTPLWWASANATNTTTGVIGLKSDDLKYSVVSEIRTEDRDGDGLADHLYFGDLGGQLFRIDLDNKASSATSFAKAPRLLLNLHKASGTTGTSPRFYEMPAFSIYDYAGTTFAVVSIGSGNRSTPLKDYTVGTTGYDYDAVYNVYDKDVAARNLYNSGYSYATTTVTTADLDNGNLGEVKASNRNDNTTLVAPYAKKGWFYRFQSNKLQSAKVFATPIAINNRLFVSTFDGSKPGLSGDCGAGVKGESFLNQFCMPYGQCDKTVASGSGIACSTGDGCSLGAGIQYTAIVDDTADCDPTKQECGGGGGNGGPGPGDGKNNKNYCVSTGNRGAMTNNGVISAGSSKMCLIPQRWYERSR
ncbi:PilC/PilY family type IV pilus protein [Acinetobacter courvalinii]|uniref:PilC/PilY family type IV pilus protein n=1 Tax=Acinetobacter courvalinii TaxID=280147 RepID=UPI0021D05313|nr:PilC/PilY family type IV pilus protein [Acinetobacter courvalinii]MCU4640166.1 pilus assembly protein PilY [Acinetobacter courvalinii]